MFYVYVLSSTNYKKSYVGCTDNPDRRIKEHNSGKMAFTKRFKPWELIYHEKFETLGEARKRESYLKTSAGRRFLKKILNSF
ncbi:MAG: GIY-YIG nuclease family protein [Patescibacteria group bacterium]|jgi:putative endonuclease